MIGLENATGNGTIVARVAITEQDLEPKLEQSLRDAFHQVGAKGVNRSLDPNTPYQWTVEPEIVVPPVIVPDPTLTKPKPADDAKLLRNLRRRETCGRCERRKQQIKTR